MKIAVLSGKGGTGKTLLSVNLAYVSDHGSYIDCDVEEPNGNLFFKAKEIEKIDISVKIPVVNTDLCNGCRTCVDFCKFNALAFINNKVKVFDDICHSCGGCKVVCKENAIREKDKIIGVIEKGKSGDVDILSGILNTGEASGVPIIKKLFEYTSNEVTIIDCPPGSACIVMESIKDADYCILVAEPTLFGSYNLEMVHELVKLFKKPYGALLNKCMEGENPSRDYCYKNNIKIIDQIDFDYKLGELNSNALIVSKEDKKYFDKFTSILNKVVEEIKNEAIINPQW